MFDVAIIGAGINGACVAHELTQKGKRVAIFDMEGVAGGGSGAAGAFISPKFSKEGELRELLNDAFVYSLAFYTENFSRFLRKAPLLHIAKDEEEASNIRAYKQDTPLALCTPPKELLARLTPHAKTQESVCIEAGVADAQGMCRALCKNAQIVRLEVRSLVYDDGMWIINETYAAKEVVLATGAYEPLLREPYNPIRGIWGHRIDVATTTPNDFSLHQFVSIAPSFEGVLAVGATHNVHYHPQKNKEPYDIEAGRAELLEKASRTMVLENVEVLKDYTGLRSGSSDYMPLVGRVVMAEETLAAKAQRFDTKNPDYELFSYYPNLTMINGNGGYGFVLAPYLAKMLSEYIVSEKEIPPRLVPARFFARWARRRK